MKVRVLREAEAEISEAAAHYGREAPTVVARFFAEVDQALARIAARPRAYAPIDRRYRGCIVGRFPYTIVYEVGAAEIEVLAFAHQRRRPGYWRERLKADE